MSNKTKSIIKRFIKGMLSGAIASMLLVSLVVPSSFGELATIINNLALAGAYGAVTGVLLAIQKMTSWVD